MGFFPKNANWIKEQWEYGWQYLHCCGCCRWSHWHNQARKLVLTCSRMLVTIPLWKSLILKRLTGAGTVVSFEDALQWKAQKAAWLSKGGCNGLELGILGSDLETLSAPTMEGLEELITVCSFACPRCISGFELRHHRILIYLYSEKLSVHLLWNALRSLVCSCAFPLCISGFELSCHHIFMYLYDEQWNSAGNVT